MTKALAKEIKKQDKIEIKAAVSKINDLMLQKKAFMSLIASKALCKYLQEQEIQIVSENDNLSGLLLLKDFDIANIIVEDNVKIAVRAFVGDEYPQMCIPRSHFLNNILADIYVGVRLETKIDNAEFVGFIEVTQINRQKGNEKYVSIDVNELKPIDTIKHVISSIDKRKSSHFASDHEKARELFFQYIDNRILSSNKEFFARHIASCAKCSQEFNQIIEMDNILKASKESFGYEEDYTLKLFAGDSLFFGEEVEINIEEKLEESDPVFGSIQEAVFEVDDFEQNIEEIESSIDQETSGQKKKKPLHKRKFRKAVATTGKLLLVGGAVLGGAHAASAMQAVGAASLVSGAASAIAPALINGIAKGVSSISGYFPDETLPEKTEIFNSNNKDFSDEMENISLTNFEDTQEISSAEEFLSNIDEANNLILENSFSDLDFNNIETENFEDYNEQNNSDIQENILSANNEILENLALIDENIENTSDLVFEEDNSLLTEEHTYELGLVDEDLDNISAFNLQEDDYLLTNEEIAGDLTENHLTELEPLEQLPEIGKSELINEELSLVEDHEETVSLHEEAQAISTGFEEIQHKDFSLGLADEQKDYLETEVSDIAEETNLDDLLASLETVEVVDYDHLFNAEESDTDDDSDLENKSLGLSDLDDEDSNNFWQQDISLKNENLINEIYEEQESIPERYQGIKFNSGNNIEPGEGQSLVASELNKFEGKQASFNEYEESDYDLEKAKSNPINLKAAGMAAAGVAAAIAIAIALFVNSKTNLNQPVPNLANQPPINNIGSMPVPPQPDNNMANNTTPQNNLTGVQGETSRTIRHREPLHNYQRQVTPASQRKDLSAVLANAFTRRTYEIDIRNISWEITADMAQNVVFKNYIMVTGQALKSALARDLAMAKERALNTQMEIKTVMDLNGNILEANVAQSSGSKEVDKICLDTYRTTLQFTKLPRINVIGRDKIKANLIVSF